MNELTQFLVSHGGSVLFASVFAEQAGLPLPSAPWLLAAGAISVATLNQLGFSALLLTLVLVAGYIGIKYVRRRRPSIGRIHHGNARGPEAEASDEKQGVARVIAPQGAGHVLSDQTASLEREGIALALTTTASQTAGEDAPSSLVQAAPCGL